MEWLLYTNVPVLSAEHARKILESYRARWRVEEFHRTWKRGGCNVEDAQLRSPAAIIKWATVLAAVATRIERIKYLARTRPNDSALLVFTPAELFALKLDRICRSGLAASTATTPTIAEAIEWLAELGGWTGAANGPPGAITLGRGLERLAYLVAGFSRLAECRSRGFSATT